MQSRPVQPHPAPRGEDVAAPIHAAPELCEGDAEVLRNMARRGAGARYVAPRCATLWQLRRLSHDGFIDLINAPQGDLVTLTARGLKALAAHPFAAARR